MAITSKIVPALRGLQSITNPMRVFLTGGTGFIGRTLVASLLRAGHEVSALVRDLPRARETLGPEVELLRLGIPDAELAQELGRADAVVSLAGEPLLGGRWTARKKEALRASRLDLTARLINALGHADPRPGVFVSASAVGIYGDAGANPVSEDSPVGSDFLSQLCRDWEAEAIRAEEHGMRVVRMRIGVVLGRGGGALAKMLPAFRLGLGGPIGSGEQYVSWIHLDDLTGLFMAALEDHRFRGPVNATAPEPVTFKRLATSIGKAIRKPAFLPVPAFAIRLVFGQASVVLLGGQRALPVRAQELGFEFQFQTIEAATRDLLSRSG